MEEEPVTTDSPKRKDRRPPPKKLLLVGGGLLLVMIAISSLFGGRSARPSTRFFAREPSFPADAFKVLIVADDSRESAPYGSSALFGARAAAAMLNEKGGINGKKVAVEGMVAGETDEDALESVARYLQKHPVQLLLDATDELVSPGVLRAAYSEKTLGMVVRDGSCRTGTGMTESKVSSYLWSLGLTRESVTEPFLAFLADKRGKPETTFQVVFMSGDDPIDLSTIAGVKQTSESLGFKTLDSQSYDVRLREFYTVARDILVRVPDLVFVANRSEPGRLFMEQAYKLSLGRDMAIAGLQIFDEEWQPVFGKTTEGVFTVARYAAEVDTPENKEFLSYFNRKEKSSDGKEKENARRKIPTPTAALSWSGVLIASQAAAATKSIDSTALAAKLGEMEFKLPNGHAFFDPRNHVLVQKMYGLRIKEGKYVIVEGLGDAHHPETQGCN